jgi:hypothetical protein
MSQLNPVHNLTLFLRFWLMNLPSKKIYWCFNIWLFYCLCGFYLNVLIAWYSIISNHTRKILVIHFRMNFISVSPYVSIEY